MIRKTADGRADIDLHQGRGKFSLKSPPRELTSEGLTQLYGVSDNDEHTL